ncbi:MAG: hypothetical protein M1835_006628 [Candelina submexicana]|nr:MAG: hypothetical protein M1835_006628 [Candelina submexicana]
MCSASKDPMETNAGPSTVTDEKHSFKRAQRSRHCLQRLQPVKIGRADLLVAAAAAYDDHYFRQQIKPKLTTLGSPGKVQDVNHNSQSQPLHPLPGVATSPSHAHLTGSVSSFARKLQRLQGVSVPTLAFGKSSTNICNPGGPVLTSIISLGGYTRSTLGPEGRMDSKRSTPQLQSLTDEKRYPNGPRAPVQPSIGTSSEDSLGVPDQQHGVNEYGKRPASEPFPDSFTHNKQTKLRGAFVGSEVRRLTADTPASINSKRKASTSCDSESSNQKRLKTSHAIKDTDTIAESISDTKPTLRSSPGCVANASTRVEGSPILKITRKTATARTTLFANDDHANARRMIALLRARKSRSNSVAKSAATNEAITNVAPTTTNAPVVSATAAKETVLAPKNTNLAIPGATEMQPAGQMDFLGKRKRAEALAEPSRRECPISECAQKYHYHDAVKTSQGEIHLPGTIAAKTRDIWSSRPIQPFSFLDLPPELRNQIYTLVLRESETIVPQYLMVEEWHNMPYGGRIKAQTTVSKRDPAPFSRPLSILRSNKQIRNEAVAVFYSQKEIKLGGMHHVWRFLNHIGPDARSVITELTFQYNKRKSAKRAIEMLAECTRLEKVHITIDETALLGNDKSQKTPMIADKDDPSNIADTISPLSDVEGMKELSEVRGLQDVVIVLVNNFPPLSDSSREQFGNWLAEGMKRAR